MDQRLIATVLYNYREILPAVIATKSSAPRLQHSAVTINITGESYRGVKARKLASKKKDA